MLSNIEPKTLGLPPRLGRSCACCKSGRKSAESASSASPKAPATAPKCRPKIMRLVTTKPKRSASVCCSNWA